MWGYGTLATLAAIFVAAEFTSAAAISSYTAAVVWRNFLELEDGLYVILRNLQPAVRASWVWLIVVVAEDNQILIISSDWLVWLSIQIFHHSIYRRLIDKCCLASQLTSMLIEIVLLCFLIVIRSPKV